MTDHRLDPELLVAAEAVRQTCGACLKAEREIGCQFCWSVRYRGCAFIAHAVLEAQAEQQL